MKTFTTLTTLLLKNWMRSRVSLFFGLLFPVILFLVVGNVFGGPQTPSYSLYVRNLDVDESGRSNQLSKVFVEVLNTTVFDVQLLGEGETPRQTGFAAVRVLTIPRGFTEQLMNKTIANRMDIMVDTITWFLKTGGENIPASERENIERGIREMKDFRGILNATPVKLTIEGSADDRLLQPIEGIVRNIAARFELALLNASEAITVQAEVVAVRQLKLVDYYLPGYIAAFVMTNGLIGVSSLVSDLRRRGVVKLLASTNVGKTTWIGSMMVVQIFAAALLTAVMLAVGWLVFGIRALPEVLSVGIILMAVTAFTGFGILVGGLVKEADAITAAGNLLSLPQMFLAGVFWPLEIMPAFMQQIALYTPLYHFHNALRNTLVTATPETAIPSFAVIAAVTVLAAILSVVFTKWKDF